MLTSLAALVALTGCGDGEVSRGTSGAAIGAGAGAAICAFTIVGLIPCAIAGGALGAAGGVATAGPDEVSPGSPAAAGPSAVAASTGTTAGADVAPGEPTTTTAPRVGVTAEPLK